MGKLNDNGSIAVLYSPGYGAGWSTWNYKFPEIMFDPAIVKLVLQGKLDELETFVTLKYPGIYTGGLKDVEIMWLPEGTLFRIYEYDGAESIELQENVDWLVA